jgi:hypothetical protein
MAVKSFMTVANQQVYYAAEIITDEKMFIFQAATKSN